jgi:hypothetical protein
VVASIALVLCFVCLSFYMINMTASNPVDRWLRESHKAHKPPYLGRKEGSLGQELDQSVAEPQRSATRHLFGNSNRCDREDAQREPNGVPFCHLLGLGVVQ